MARRRPSGRRSGTKEKERRLWAQPAGAVATTNGLWLEGRKRARHWARALLDAQRLWVCVGRAPAAGKAPNLLDRPGDAWSGTLQAAAGPSAT